MTGVNWRAVLTAAIASFVALAVTASAQARDGERWERERWEHHHHFVPPGHRYHDERAQRVVYERQPVMAVPGPVNQGSGYSQPMNPSLNLNFTIPLH